MSLKKTYEFEAITKDILNHEKFCSLKEELHHGISRYHHCVRVAKCTYFITKKLNLDYERATRAALLHDFFSSTDVEDLTSCKAFTVHPEIALKNARQYFDLDLKQENIISSHMFPACKAKPKCLEAWVTSCADKGVAFYEIYRFKLSLVMGVWILFLFNMISIQK